MPYPKNSINTGLALQVIASDSLPIPSPAAYTLLGTASPLISGTVTSLGTDQLLDNSGVNFQSTISPLPVLVDDKAFNTTADPDTVATITGTGPAGLGLNADIFTVGLPNYTIIRSLTLCDDDGVFVDGFKKAGGVSVGDIVYNTTALTSASITSIRDNKLMTLSADIFGTPALANDSYRIFANPNGQLGVTSQSSTEACLLYVGSNSTGPVVDVRVKTSAGNDVTFTDVKVGSVLPVQVLQLYSTGTTVESRNNCIAIW